MTKRRGLAKERVLAEGRNALQLAKSGGGSYRRCQLLVRRVELREVSCAKTLPRK